MCSIIHPVQLEDEGLPFIVCGIGSQESQCHIIRKEGHPQHQLIFTTAGSGILKVDGQEYEIVEDTIIYLKPNETHEYFPKTPKWATDWIQFRGDAAENTLKKLGFTESKSYTYLNNFNIRSLFNDLMVNLSSNAIFKDLTASGLFYTLLIELYKSSYVKVITKDKQVSLLINPIISYINANYMKDITLEELASLVKITPQYLCKVFKEHLNLRPFEYIAKKRIQEAKRLLNHTTLSVNEISQTIGYKDCSYFCANFKKFESISPSEFRGAAKLRKLTENVSG